MQIDLQPEPIGGYETINTAFDALPGYAFACLVFNPTPVTTAKVIIDIMNRTPA